MGLFSSTDNSAVLSHLARLERKVDLLLEHLGIQPHEPDWMAHARALAASGDKIGAIKLHRQHTGAGLAEAKAQVDSW